MYLIQLHTAIVMTSLSKILLFFPTFILLITGLSLVYFIYSLNPLSIIAVLFSLYGLPLLTYRLHQLFYPIREGISYLRSKEYSPWWGSHQIQVIYIAIPALEAILRLIPGLFSCWLRLWGAKIGKNIYWNPGLEIADRALIEIGDNVIVGHRVTLLSHVIKPRKQDLMLYVKKVKIGNNVFLGSASQFGPGTVINDGTYIPVLSNFYINQKV